MILPGGLKRGDEWLREFTLRPLDGHSEIILSETLTTHESWPNRLTRILDCCVSHIGGEDADFDRLHDLCVGDRHVIVRALILQLGSDLTWFTQDCSDCGEKFDFSLRYSDLPLKPAGKSFPEVTVKLPNHDEPWTFRVPTGRDQDALDGYLDEAMVRKKMIQLLLISGSRIEFTDAEEKLIEKAIEETMPELGFNGQVTCPNCQSETSVSLDPYARLRSFQADAVFRDVDTIARHYHWSEREILGLSRSRRKRYLAIIESTHGTSQATSSHHVA
ncbi:hypothetical protein ACFQY0_01525 [Haloferula chungangensis]|uniref:Phage baseplate protein n=1 Tax=Haloferula chungangensis TaxID=1048331 RepID=A0ABW2L3X6_9BACT